MYEKISEESEKIIRERKRKYTNEYAARDESVIRRVDNMHDYLVVWRNSYVRDTDKILNCPFYNRFIDKTQVFSLCKNDDITRRGSHVQLVSRIGRTIGEALGLNTDLIEAISLGHDIGHTPFAHMGERVLDNISRSDTGERFRHSLQSVRVLDKIFSLNCSLQTLAGIAFHDGENEVHKYETTEINDFKRFDEIIEDCLGREDNFKKYYPSTLEGCVVRISDIIAYLGKDVQDANRLHVLNRNTFINGSIGVNNSELINNLIVNIIDNSLDKPYIKIDDEHFESLKKVKKENYDYIYNDGGVNEHIKDNITPMMERMYEKLKLDLFNNDTNSYIFRHHIRLVEKYKYKREKPYVEEDKRKIVIDYIASMTDDYFIDLYNEMFPNDRIEIKYKGYFD